MSPVGLSGNTFGSVNIKATFGTNNDVPQNTCVPVLSCADSCASISIVWNKPDNYADVVDYNVYMNGKNIGSASANNAINSVVYPYIKHFYADDTTNFHNTITYHNFKATGLSPNTAYTFYVTSVHSSGKESAASVSIVQQTAPTFTNIVKITASGAVGDGSTVNTKAIQQAIDTCSSKSQSAYGCKVWKKEPHCYDLLNLLISTKYQPSLVTAQYKGSSSYSDIRITGEGTIDGNGWIKNSADVTDEVGNKLPYYAHGSTTA
uniref:Fibronectin type-III domain-containing protein n=1 Tax=Ditylenchus dipsaci TaxID=166011 RepID=A0A915CN82_9BILA